MDHILERAKIVIKDRVDKLITEGTADAIAQRFIDQGIKAECGEPEQCAIAVYLMRELDVELGVQHGVQVGVPGGRDMDYVYVYRSGQVPITDPVKFSAGVLGEFTEKFDTGKYKELENAA